MPIKQADRIQVIPCDDPECGPHLILYDVDGEAFAEAIIGADWACKFADEIKAAVTESQQATVEDKEPVVKADAELDAMSDGDFYHYMLDKDHIEWARQINRKGGFGLNPHMEEMLAIWLASAMMAPIDRPNADYIKERLDSEHAEDAKRNTKH